MAQAFKNLEIKTLNCHFFKIHYSYYTIIFINKCEVTIMNRILLSLLLITPALTWCKNVSIETRYEKQKSTQLKKAIKSMDLPGAVEISKQFSYSRNPYDGHDYDCDFDMPEFLEKYLVYNIEIDNTVTKQAFEKAFIASVHATKLSGKFLISFPEDLWGQGKELNFIEGSFWH